MLPTLFFIIILLVVLAVLPHINPTAVIDEDDSDESPRLRLKSTRQR